MPLQPSKDRATAAEAGTQAAAADGAAAEAGTQAAAEAGTQAAAEGATTSTATQGSASASAISKSTEAKAEGETIEITHSSKEATGATACQKEEMDNRQRASDSGRRWILSLRWQVRWKSLQA